MKHRSLIFGIIAVLALGLIGYGYAAWSSTVTTTASVNTGTFLFGIAAPATGATSDLAGTGGIGTGTADQVWNDTTNAVEAASPALDVGSLTETNTGTTVSGLDGYFNGVTETYDNVYPDYDATYTLNVKNGGTIPIALHTLGLDWGGTPTTFSSNYVIDSWTLTDTTTSGLLAGNTTDGTGTAFSSIEGKLLPAGDTAQLVVNAHFTDIPDNSLPKGGNASYTITITGNQFNH